MSTNNQKNEFRQDIISLDWILVASKREEYFRKLAEKNRAERIKKEEYNKNNFEEKIKNCPFENPQKSENGESVLSLKRDGTKINKPAESSLSSVASVKEEWFIQIIPNKNPALESHYETCSSIKDTGIYSNIEALGFHEVVITRDHDRYLSELTEKEIEVLFNAYKERYLTLMNKKCLKYILIFHNSGKEAGASIEHPHSQIMALPIIPPDVKRSLLGAEKYFSGKKKCGHCDMINWELKDGKEERVIYKNSDFIVMCPYASRANFEIRIFPIKHKSNFESITTEEIINLGEVIKHTFKKIHEKLENPAYNFFIHTAPIGREFDYYHWHIEILPRLSIWGGMELGTGIEVIVMPPEKAAEILK